MDRDRVMFDTMGIGQPFTWTHTERMFMLARFGDDILTALTWAARQQRIVVKTCAASQKNHMISLEHCVRSTS